MSSPKESNKINTRRGVRHGDTVPPRLFMAALQSIFRRLTWETRGLKIDGEYLCHFHFADDILVCAKTPHELQQMLQELADESEYQGLKMNKSKTKGDGKQHTNICQQHSDREHRKLLLSGTEVQHKNKEIQRRVMVGRTSFARQCYIFKGNIGTCLMRQVDNSCVLPAMKYGSETWALTSQANNS